MQIRNKRNLCLNSTNDISKKPCFDTVMCQMMHPQRSIHCMVLASLSLAPRFLLCHLFHLIFVSGEFFFPSSNICILSSFQVDNNDSRENLKVCRWINCATKTHINKQSLNWLCNIWNESVTKHCKGKTQVIWLFFNAKNID